MSSEQNPNNYPGVTATIVGWASGDARYPAYDKEGKNGFMELRIPVQEGYKPKGGGEFVKTHTTWYTYKAHQDTIGNVTKGTKVRIDDAKLESREFPRKDGTTGQEFLLTFGEFTVLDAPDADESPF